MKKIQRLWKRIQIAAAHLATGQILQSTVSVPGSASNYAHGAIVFSVAWPVTLAELAGVAIGVRIVHALPLPHIKRFSGLLCLGIGVYLALRVLFF